MYHHSRGYVGTRSHSWRTKSRQSTPTLNGKSSTTSNCARILLLSSDRSWSPSGGIGIRISKPFFISPIGPVRGMRPTALSLEQWGLGVGSSTNDRPRRPHRFSGNSPCCTAGHSGRASWNRRCARRCPAQGGEHAVAGEVRAPLVYGLRMAATTGPAAWSRWQGCRPASTPTFVSHQRGERHANVGLAPPFGAAVSPRGDDDGIQASLRVEADRVPGRVLGGVGVLVHPAL